MKSSKPRTPHERAWDRWEARNPFPSNDVTRATQFVWLNVCDNSGGQFFLDFSDEHILELVRLARDIRAELVALEAEERARGELRIVRGGKS